LIARMVFRENTHDLFQNAILCKLSNVSKHKKRLKQFWFHREHVLSKYRP
jgi:hypothetical protein